MKAHKPIQTQCHQIYWLSTTMQNHCWTKPTQYTASSCRNVELSQLDIVSHLDGIVIKRPSNYQPPQVSYSEVVHTAKRGEILALILRLWGAGSKIEGCLLKIICWTLNTSLTTRRVERRFDEWAKRRGSNSNRHNAMLTLKEFEFLICFETLCLYYCK